MSRILELIKAAQAQRASFGVSAERLLKAPPAARAWPCVAAGEAASSRSASRWSVALAAALGFISGSLFPVAESPFFSTASSSVLSFVPPPETAGHESEAELRLDTRLPMPGAALTSESRRLAGS